MDTIALRRPPPPRHSRHARRSPNPKSLDCAHEPGPLRLGGYGRRIVIVAVTAADPVGISRFLRQMPEVRGIVGDTPIVVVANRLRPGALGVDARGQVRRTLERFGSVRDVWFVPQDPRSADAALLSARSIAETAPRSPFTHAIRRFVGEAILPPDPARGRRAA